MIEREPRPAPNDEDRSATNGQVVASDGETECLVAARVAGRGGEEPEAFLGVDHRPADTIERSLGDFTTGPAILRLVPLVLFIGGLGAGISLALLDMIEFSPTFFYHQRLSVHLVSPAANTLGALAIVIPVGGGLAVGLMARFGSEQIRGPRHPRGHGADPMIGGLLIGIGGLIEPRALGVGYDIIDAELLGQLAVGALALLLVVKLVIWSALGAGTSGGVLAPS